MRLSSVPNDLVGIGLGLECKASEAFAVRILKILMKAINNH